MKIYIYIYIYALKIKELYMVSVRSSSPFRFKMPSDIMQCCNFTQLTTTRIQKVAYFTTHSTLNFFNIVSH